jgi:hypothetical protein
MVVNETINATLFELSKYISKASIGLYINEVLFVLGGLGGATLIYFSLMIYFQHKQYKKMCRQEELLLLELEVLAENRKMLQSIHKVLIPVEDNNRHE